MSADILTLLQSLKMRIPFSTAKTVFKQHNLTPGRGWESTIEKFEDENYYPASLYSDLLSFLKEHYIFGEKACYFFYTEDKNIQHIKSKLSEYTVKKSKMGDAYPLLLNCDELNECHSFEPNLVKIEKFPSGTAFIFGSIRLIQQKEIFDPDTLVTKDGNKLSGYEEFFGVKTIRQQAMDTVWIPEGGNLIELHIDHTKKLHANQFYSKKTALLNAFLEIVECNPFEVPVNLFPLLKKMSEATNEGRLVEMAFGTTTHSVKHEKMRLSDDCLRSELYHVGGKQRLNTPLMLYKIGVSYTVPFPQRLENKPELSLSTMRSVAEGQSPELYGAIIHKNIGFYDYDFIKRRIFHFLP